MPEAISNTSPLLYLHRIGVLDWLPRLFTRVWAPAAVVEELRIGREGGHDVPDPTLHSWIQVATPESDLIQWLSEWSGHALGSGELGAIILGTLNRSHVLLLDDHWRGKPLDHLDQLYGEPSGCYWRERHRGLRLRSRRCLSAFAKAACGFQTNYVIAP